MGEFDKFVIVRIYSSISLSLCRNFVVSFLGFIFVLLFCRCFGRKERKELKLECSEQSSEKMVVEKQKATVMNKTQNC